MKKATLFAGLSLLLALPLLSQKGDLLARRGEKGLFLDHKVVAKESFFSVGRLYNLHPGTIASYNKLDMGKGLFIDQKIRIPLTDTNFTQKGNSGTPVYYRVGDKETLSKISKDCGNVTLASLRAWNKLANDDIKKDQKLVIGFLLSKEMKSVTLDKPKAEEATEKVTEVTPVKTEDPVVIKEPVTEEKKTAPVEEPKVKPADPVKDDSKTVIPEQGYFKTHFDQQVHKTPVSKEETVTAGIFKTASGWQDGKYYLLIDAVQPGVVIKVINPVNNKAVFAKVLGAMSGIRQNEGLNIRISNAAATVLGITETDKFIVKITY